MDVLTTSPEIGKTASVILKITHRVCQLATIAGVGVEQEASQTQTQTKPKPNPNSNQTQTQTKPPTSKPLRTCLLFRNFIRKRKRGYHWIWNTKLQLISSARLVRLSESRQLKPKQTPNSNSNSNPNPNPNPHQTARGTDFLLQLHLKTQTGHQHIQETKWLSIGFSVLLKSSELGLKAKPKPNRT